MESRLDRVEREVETRHGEQLGESERVVDLRAYVRAVSSLSTAGPADVPGNVQGRSRGSCTCREPAETRLCPRSGLSSPVRPEFRRKGADDCIASGETARTYSILVPSSARPLQSRPCLT